jgi:hypothetical protein
MKSLDESLSELKNETARVAASDDFEEPGKASVRLSFSNGSTLRADYWRVSKNGKAGVSSFDHHQQYGLPAAIDAIGELQEHVQGRAVTDLWLVKETGDLFFQFTSNVELQIFNFTGYEVGEIRFPDGTGQYSNYAK